MAKMPPIVVEVKLDLSNAIASLENLLAALRELDRMHAFDNVGYDTCRKCGEREASAVHYVWRGDNDDLG